MYAVTPDEDTAKEIVALVNSHQAVMQALNRAREIILAHVGSNYLAGFDREVIESGLVLTDPEEPDWDQEESHGFDTE